MAADVFTWCQTPPPKCGKPLHLTTARLEALKVGAPVHCDVCLTLQEVEVLADRRLAHLGPWPTPPAEELTDRPNAWGDEE